jgi:hypothetical protein
MQGNENCQNADEEEYVWEGLTPHAQEQGVGSGNSRTFGFWLPLHLNFW